MTQLCREAETITSQEIEVLVVTFDSVAMANRYVKRTDLKWPMLLDSKREVYEAYGMLRGGWWANYGPITILKYLFLMFQGWFPSSPGEDWRQMGGDVLVDPDGIIRLHYASRDPLDRPSVESLIEVVQSYQ